MRSLPDDKDVPRGRILTLSSHNVQKYCARERMTSIGTSAADLSMADHRRSAQGRVHFINGDCSKDTGLIQLGPDGVM